MQCGTSLCFFKPVVLVAAVAAVGMAGFNWATTGCPLGSCDRGGEGAAVVAASADADACPLGGCDKTSEAGPVVLAAAAEERPVKACCASKLEAAGAAQVQAVAAETGCCGQACSESCETGCEASVAGEAADTGSEG